MMRRDVDVFIAELTRLTELYNRPVSEAMGALYFEAMRDYPIGDVIRAMRLHIRHPEQGRFFPKPADLIALLEGDTNSQALEAYRVLDNALLQHGVYRSVRFEDPALTATVQALGGWVEVEGRWKDREQEPYLRVDFCKLYRTYAGRSLEQATLPHHFPGLHEMGNSAKYPEAMAPPVIVGRSAQQALQDAARHEQVRRLA